MKAEVPPFIIYDWTAVFQGCVDSIGGAVNHEQNRMRIIVIYCTQPLYCTLTCFENTPNERPLDIA